MTKISLTKLITYLIAMAIRIDVIFLQFWYFPRGDFIWPSKPFKNTKLRNHGSVWRCVVVPQCKLCCSRTHSDNNGLLEKSEGEQGLVDCLILLPDHASLQTRVDWLLQLLTVIFCFFHLPTGRRETGLKYWWLDGRYWCQKFLSWVSASAWRVDPKVSNYAWNIWVCCVSTLGHRRRSGSAVAMCGRVLEIGVWHKMKFGNLVWLHVSKL